MENTKRNSQREVDEKTPSGAVTDVNSNKKNNVSVSSIAQSENMYKQFLKEWEKYFMGALK